MKQLAPGLWQLSGFPPNAINMYLAEHVLIDAATKWAKRRVLRQIKDREVSMLALTHVHPDHQGAAKAVCDELAIPLAVHADDVDGMEGRLPVQRKKPNHPLNRWGRAVWTGPPHKVDRVLEEGDVVAGFRVIHAPGHAPGEVIFFRDSDRVAISGDVINMMSLATGLPGIHEAPEFFTFDRDQARRSIVKLLDLQPSLICPGHGAPLRDISKLEAYVERHGLRELASESQPVPA
ncbi:MAG TPA: MBL fold metallo-hydrolase [Solirubrobacterales bacterium]|jgi:glyoxylase-like metal-dependent hydrolase (beta-lactamase superfamily II)|nr:MBL fold metallo-hydrolase [Solirubrobacterales bacterium]